MAAYETAQAAHERLDEKDPTFEASGTKLLARLDDVESQRGALVQLRSDVSDIKVAVHALDSELTTAKAELAAASSTIAENDRLREAIQEEERRAFREQRDAYLAEQLAEERHRIGADARADADKQLELVKQELEMEKAEKVHLLATVEHLEADAEHAQEMQREHDERAAGAVDFLFGRTRDRAPSRVAATPRPRSVRGDGTAATTRRVAAEAGSVRDGRSRPPKDDAELFATFVERTPRSPNRRRRATSVDRTVIAQVRGGRARRGVRGGAGQRESPRARGRALEAATRDGGRHRETAARVRRVRATSRRRRRGRASRFVRVGNGQNRPRGHVRGARKDGKRRRGARV